MPADDSAAVLLMIVSMSLVAQGILLLFSFISLVIQLCLIAHYKTLKITMFLSQKTDYLRVIMMSRATHTHTHVILLVISR